MPTQNVSLTDELVNFVKSQVDSGLYGNVSEVHRVALAEMARKEEERKAKIEWLKAEAKKGFDQIEAGDCTTFNTTEELGEWMDGVLQEVIAESDEDHDAEIVA